MHSFLKHTISEIYKQSSEYNALDIYLIFPSKRSANISKKLWSQQLTKPTLSPNFQTLIEFVYQTIGFEIIPSHQLSCILYECYLNTVSENQLPYIEFQKISPYLISDFNDIDLFLVNSKDILEYLGAIRTINEWSPDDPTHIKKGLINDLWHNLYPLYRNFKKKLRELKVGYQGFIFREAYKKLVNKGTDSHFLPYVHLIGFNALSKVEAEIFKFLVQEKKGKIYLDYSKNTLGHYQNSYGHFFRQNKKHLGVDLLKEEFRHTDWENKKIKILGCPTNIAQVQAVFNHLLQIKSECPEDLDETVVILADENLLPAFINYLNLLKDSINITMSYPITHSPLYQFFKKYFELILNPNEGGFPLVYFESVIQHSYFKRISQVDNSLKESIHELCKTVKNDNLLTIHFELIKKRDISTNQLLSRVFNPHLQFTQLCENLLELVQLFEENEPSQNVIENQTLKIINKIGQQLLNLSKKNPFISHLESAYIIFQEIASKEPLNFEGNNQTGVQLMGILESRVLGFKNVIITSVNEGILPEGKITNSFIPHDVRKDYGLPTFIEQDAIYTYHFYRLLEHADNITLIYNADQRKGMEESRFIKQLSLDSFFKTPITHDIVPINNIPIQENKPLEISKTQSIINALNLWVEGGVSPSALITYIRNPIDFYKRYVLKLNEPDNPEPIMGLNVLGSIIHKVLEDLYKPHIGFPLSEQIFNTMEPLVNHYTQIAFKHYYSSQFKTGYNHLSFEMILSVIYNFLKWDCQRCLDNEIIILGLETVFTYQTQLLNGKKVLLKGLVDRHETLNGIHHIIDYKTGKTETKDTKISQIAEVSDIKKTKAFQLLHYLLTLNQKGQSLTPMASVFPIMNPNLGVVSLNVNGITLIDQNTIKEFEKELILLIEEILNPEIPFLENI